MGYIKKLKNNELVGGTDKTTIYPVTSTEAVFEEVSENNFQSQRSINKEQQDELDDHEERIQAAEAEDIKSITINGSTKKFEVDSDNNVDLTIYTVDSDPDMPSIADNVRDLRDVVGTSEEVLPGSHKTRIETLEGGESITGSVENKIKTKVDSINSSYQDDNNEYVKYSMTQTSGEVTNFNIDETGLKNAITSLNTSISGDNIVIRSGSTPSGTGEAGKIYRYVNSSNNTYTDYMYSGSSWIALATHDTSDEQAQVAYYTCTATGSGAQATKQFVGNGSLTYTPSSGGHIKILMGETNTATGTIYLQYNTDSTNTKKPLYYNGEPVSTENTWEAGETIAVYYDPSANSNAGAYFASNAQGGGGKAEKIKYDNSQSGLAADNVQGALDEVSNVENEETINLAKLYKNSFAIYGGKWHAATNIFVKNVNVYPSQKYRVKAADTYGENIKFTAEYNPVDNASVEYTRLNIPRGTTAIVEIPDGMYHMILQDDHEQSGGATIFPESVVRLNNVTTTNAVQYNSENIENLQDIVMPYSVIAEYGNDDCTELNRTLNINGTISAGNGFNTSPFIAIPNDASIIEYVNLNNCYRDTFCGIVVTDSSYNVLWFNSDITAVSGTLDLNDYTNAAYIRFMYNPGSKSSVRFAKRVSVNVSQLNAEDTYNDYGSNDFTGTYSTQDNYATLDTPCLLDGVIQTIKGKFNGSGTSRFYIGFIDQNNYLVIRDSFDVNVIDGLNTLDVSERNISINEGEYLLNNTSDNTISPYFGVNPSITPKGAGANAEMRYAVRNDGVYWCFSWTVKSHKPSYSEVIDELDDIQDEIEKNSVSIAELQDNKKYFIDDRITGQTYQIVVKNGVMQLELAEFHNALILGNSLTIHNIVENLWWGEWGMAATKQEYDYVHILEQGLQEKDPNAECLISGLSPWEQDFSYDYRTRIGDKLSSDTDLVVIRLGENVPAANVSSFQSALEDLIDYIYSVAANAKIIITSMYWPNTDKDAAIRGAAESRGLDLVMINQFATSAYEEAVGHYVYGADDEIHEITNSGVALHPNNKGMAAIANAILTSIGYNRVNNTYALQEVTVGGVTGTMWVLNE